MIGWSALRASAMTTPTPIESMMRPRRRSARSASSRSLTSRTTTSSVAGPAASMRVRRTSSGTSRPSGSTPSMTRGSPSRLASSSISVSQSCDQAGGVKHSASERFTACDEWRCRMRSAAGLIDSTRRLRSSVRMPSRMFSSTRRRPCSLRCNSV